MINQIDKPQGRKIKETNYQYQHEREDITTNPTNIKWIIIDY